MPSSQRPSRPVFTYAVILSTAFLARFAVSFVPSVHLSGLPSSRVRAPLGVSPASPAAVRTSSAAAAANNLERLYVSCSNIKCPFFKRRASDCVDAAASVLKFVAVRHKSLWIDLPEGWFGEDGPDIFEVPGCQPAPGGGNPWTEKTIGASLEDAAASITVDWVGMDVATALLMHAAATTKEYVGTNGDTDDLVYLLRDAPLPLGPVSCRGYYITGRLNPSIYRNDCTFDGPDPDMPVRGLRKYVAAASGLFDSSQSKAELRSVAVCHRRRAVVVRWRLGGALALPWKPVVPTFEGTTTYFVDDAGLISKHEETWEIGAWEAFVRTAAPGAGEIIWGPLREVEKNRKIIL